MGPEFIHTYVSVDCVVFGFNHENSLNVLLVQRRNDEEIIERPKKLPGSLILSKEDVDDAAQRVLLELTGIKKMVLKQFKCYADPQRASNTDDIKWMGDEYKHNIDRIITVAYLSLCKIDHKINTTKYDTADWYPVDQVPLLPFDHNQIISESLVEIRKWIESDFSIIFQRCTNSKIKKIKLNINIIINFRITNKTCHVAGFSLYKLLTGSILWAELLVYLRLQILFIDLKIEKFS